MVTACVEVSSFEIKQVHKMNVQVSEAQTRAKLLRRFLISCNRRRTDDFSSNLAAGSTTDEVRKQEVKLESLFACVSLLPHSDEHLVQSCFLRVFPSNVLHFATRQRDLYLTSNSRKRKPESLSLASTLRSVSVCVSFSAHDSSSEQKIAVQSRLSSACFSCLLVDYFYVSREEFLRMKENGEFIESTEFSGNCYGTSKQSVADVLEAGRICILDVDVQGVKNVKELGIPAIYVFVKPPSMQILVSFFLNLNTAILLSFIRRLLFSDFTNFRKIHPKV